MLISASLSYLGFRCDAPPSRERPRHLKGLVQTVVRRKEEEFALGLVRISLHNRRNRLAYYSFEH